jgi:hypothetical protein
MDSVDLLTVTIDDKKPRYSLHKFYNKSLELLYVSIKPNVALLMRHSWWWDIDHIDIEHYQTYGALMKAKIETIEIEQPKHNKHGIDRD